MDQIVQREILMARKEGRKAECATQVIQDELFGFIVAGHDTTAATLQWGIKYLTVHQPPQQKLRAALRAAFHQATETGRQPTVDEIMSNDVPYLDATNEEILRCAGTVPGLMRRAMADTQLFGHVIPKGTEVFMVSPPPSPIRIPCII